MGMLNWLGKFLEALEIVINKGEQSAEEPSKDDKELEREKLKDIYRAKAKFDRSRKALADLFTKLEKDAAMHWENAKKYASAGMETQKKLALLAFKNLQKRIDSQIGLLAAIDDKMYNVEIALASADAIKSLKEYIVLTGNNADIGDLGDALADINMATQEIEQITSFIQGGLASTEENTPENIDVTELEKQLESEISGSADPQAIKNGLAEAQKLTDKLK